MENSQIHLSIATLESLLKSAKKTKAEGHNLSDIVRITKTAYRQPGEAEDKVETHILTANTTHPSVNYSGELVNF